MKNMANVITFLDIMKFGDAHTILGNNYFIIEK